MTHSYGVSRHEEGTQLTRITINLNERSAAALELAARLTGDSKTDTVNRALQIYAFIEQTTARGGSIYISEAGDSELKEVHIS